MTTTMKQSTFPILLLVLILATLVDLNNSFSVSIITSRGASAATYNRRCSSPIQMSDDSSASNEDMTPMVVANEEESVPPSKPPVKCPDCDQCDGSGRILGGIGVVLPWWPIKAYRPCPKFIDRGGFYQRSGQGLDEIAFGRDSTFDARN